MKSGSAVLRRQVAQHHARRRIVHAEAVEERRPSRSTFLPSRVRVPDEVAEREERRAFDGLGEGHARQRRDHAGHVDLVREAALEHEVVQAGRLAPGPLDHLEHRRRLQPVAVEAEQEVVDEMAEALARDDPEVVAVVGDLLRARVEPGGAGDAVLCRVAAGDDRGGGGRGDRGKDA